MNTTRQNRAASCVTVEKPYLRIGQAIEQVLPVRFRITIDGQEPGNDRGSDVDAKGNGGVREQRLCHLIRKSGAVQDHTFAIEFLDPGVRAYAFTFG